MKHSIGLNRIRQIGDDGVLVKAFCGWHGHAPGRSVQHEPHRDDYYMFGIVFSGTVVITVDFREIELHPGDILITMPGQIHCVGRHDDDAAGYLIGIAAEHLSDDERAAVDRRSLSPKPVSLSESEREDIKKLLEVLTHYRLLTLAKSIISIILFSTEKPGEAAIGRFSAITLRFKTLLDQNLATEKRPSAYAAMMNISEVYLNEAVKSTTGLSVSKFIMARVVLQAKRLFAHTAMTAQQVALQLGYADYAYFSRLFKKTEGVSPSDYRKKP